MWLENGHTTLPSTDCVTQRNNCKVQFCTQNKTNSGLGFSYCLIISRQFCCLCKCGSPRKQRELWRCPPQASPLPFSCHAGGQAGAKYAKQVGAGNQHSPGDMLKIVLDKLFTQRVVITLFLQQKEIIIRTRGTLITHQDTFHYQREVIFSNWIYHMMTEICISFLIIIRIMHVYVSMLFRNCNVIWIRFISLFEQMYSGIGSHN